MARKILLTGGSGMVGRNIRDHPASESWEILAPSSRQLDLMQASVVEDYIAEKKPDLIVHCAGKVGGIHANMSDPVEFLDRNVTIGRNVIMGAHNVGVKKLINLASTCIYPREASNPLNEDSILTGALEPTNEGYAIAKILALRFCQYIRRENPELQFKTLIPCNLYGRYDKFDPENSHLVPAIIRKVHEAKLSGQQAVEIWGDGKARREFMYAGDFANALVQAINSLETLPDLMNIGVGIDYSINDYYKAVARVIGWQGTFEHDISKPVGMAQKLSDTSRQTEWGWQPATSLDDGIAKTYEYFMETLKT